MRKDELRKRTKDFALAILALSEKILNTVQGNIIKNQIVKSGTSVGANYRASKRAKSNRDFINKLAIVEEEADETLFWLEILVASGMLKDEDVADIYQEGDEILSMVVAAIRTSKKKEI